MDHTLKDMDLPCPPFLSPSSSLKSSPLFFSLFYSPTSFCLKFCHSCLSHTHVHMHKHACTDTCMSTHMHAHSSRSTKEGSWHCASNTESLWRQILGPPNMSLIPFKLIDWSLYNAGRQAPLYKPVWSLCLHHTCLHPITQSTSQDSAQSQGQAGTIYLQWEKLQNYLANSSGIKIDLKPWLS